jgi:Protein of unknown function (DUF4232)
MRQGGAALGTAGGYLAFANQASAPCRLSGWPRLIGIPASGRSTTAAQARSTMFGPYQMFSHIPVVTLRGGERADAVFVGSGIAPGPGPCPPPRPYRYLRVTPPGGTESVRLSAWLPGLDAYLPACAGIRVSFVVPASDLYRG